MFILNLFHQPIIYVSCLNILSCSIDIRYLLFGVQIIIDTVLKRRFRQLVAEKFQILIDIDTRFIFILTNIIFVIIPVKMTRSILLDTPVKGCFYLLHHVESHKQVGIITQVQSVSLNHMAV